MSVYGLALGSSKSLEHSAEFRPMKDNRLGPDRLTNNICIAIQLSRESPMRVLTPKNEINKKLRILYVIVFGQVYL